jgi:hypothetical protein
MAETASDKPGDGDGGIKIPSINAGDGDKRDESGISGAEIINPADAIAKPEFDINQPFDVAAALDTGSGTGRKRGRRPGSTNKKKTSLDISGVEKILLSMHAMASAAFHVPELELDEKEAKQLADAANNVASHYAVDLDPKTLAWINLLWALSMVYGTRGVAFVSRKRSEARTTPPDETANGATDGMEALNRLPTRLADLN